MFAFALHLDSSEILGPVRKVWRSARQCYTRLEKKSTESTDLALRTNSYCAVLLYNQNDPVYQKVKIFVTCLGTSKHSFYDNASFQFGVYLAGKKTNKQTINVVGYICFGLFVCFGGILLPCKGPQKFILHSCVEAKLCRQNLFQALVDVHADSILCDGTSGDHDRRL